MLAVKIPRAPQQYGLPPWWLTHGKVEAILAEHCRFLDRWSPSIAVEGMSVAPAARVRSIFARR
jgi:hypothetical protein